MPSIKRLPLKLNSPKSPAPGFNLNAPPLSEITSEVGAKWHVKKYLRWSKGRNLEETGLLVQHIFERLLHINLELVELQKQYPFLVGFCVREKGVKR